MLAPWTGCELPFSGRSGWPTPGQGGCRGSRNARKRRQGLAAALNAVGSLSGEDGPSAVNDGERGRVQRPSNCANTCPAPVLAPGHPCATLSACLSPKLQL